MWWKKEPKAIEAGEPVITSTTNVEPSTDPTNTTHTSTEPPKKEPYPIRNINDRLSLPLGLRLPLAITISSFSGLILGITKGSIDTGFVFRAENAHRLPKTQTGWFLYHKSKNYNMMLGGIKEGFRHSFRLGAWTGLYFLLEEGVDRGRAANARLWRKFWGGEWAKGGREMRMAAIMEMREVEEVMQEEAVKSSRDCLSSMLAGLGTAGMFSAWNRFPLPTAARTAKMGAKAGLAFGLLQDAMSVVKGRRVGYVEFVKRHMAGVGGEDEKMPV